MVVILDLGDGLDETEQERYDTLAERIRAEQDTVVLWAAGDPVPDDCKPLPPGVIAWAKVDIDAPNPRDDYNHLACLSSARAGAWLQESSTLDDVVREYVHTAVEEELRKRVPDVAAFATWNNVSSGGTFYGYITRGAVLTTVGTPTTPEEVETFLALDVNERGQQILDSEIEEYEQWANGEVYLVCATNTLTGQDTAVGGCYDSTADHRYLRTVVDEIVGEVAAP